MGKQFNIAIVGATGAVGTELLRVLEERAFPVKSLRLLASERSDGEFLEFAGEEIMVQKLTDDSFAGIDLAFFSAGSKQSLEFCPLAAAAGAVCIDNSSAWRLDPDVPLVVPEVNGDGISGYTGKGIVANPDCSTIQMAMALKPLHDAARVKRVVVATYQGVSGAGRKAIDELRIQTGELLNGRPADSSVFQHQIAFNCLPHIGSFLANGCSEEEMNLAAETRKVLGDDSIGVTATAVRVPVFYGHSEAINIETEKKISTVQVRDLLAAAPGIRLVDDMMDGDYPMPINAAGQDLILAGRIREDETIPNGLNLWLAADNLRKGAATNSVQIAEILVEKYL